MKLPESLQTERLLLRRWCDFDVVMFAEINADPKVMEFFPSTLSFEYSADSVKRIEAHFERNCYGLWAVEIKSTKEFIGFVGLQEVVMDVHFAPAVEIGWRLKYDAWGKGYAPEAAREAMRDGFERLDLSELVSMTSTVNIRSMKVMKKIGMTRNPADDFLHPKIADDSPLKPHVLFRLSRKEWSEGLKRSL